MYEDDEIPDDRAGEAARDPATRAQEKADEFRMHAERAAVYEGRRKYDFEIRTNLDGAIARDVQKRIAKLEKAKNPESPILRPESMADAAALLDLPTTARAMGLTTGDYHVHRRPGEVMIVRWLEGEQVDTYYARLQAHFDAAMEGLREDERQAHGWKQDPAITKYLDALDKIEVKMAERYLRDLIKAHGLFVLSTQTADEMDILHLCDTLMGVPPAELVGSASAPPDEAPTERDRAWFFKLFALRGVKKPDGGAESVEQMCFFTFLQKTEDTFDLD